MRKDYAIDATLSEIRQRLVDGMLKIFIVLSIPALAVSLYRIKDTIFRTCCVCIAITPYHISPDQLLTKYNRRSDLLINSNEQKGQP